MNVRSSKLIESLGGPSLLVLAACLVVVVGIWVFILLAEAVKEGTIRRLDEWAARAARRSDAPQIPRGPHWLIEVARDVTSLGSISVLLLTTGAVAGYLLMVRKYGAMWLVAAAAMGGVILGSTLKYLFARGRPDAVLRLTEFHFYSFPSGHSMMSAVVYLTLGALLARFEKQRRVKMYFILIALLLTALIGITRVYLGVHYASDVLAGWTAGLVWAVICWLVARYLQRTGAVEPEK
jgi:undecaprenyl-diphosphatase